MIDTDVDNDNDNHNDTETQLTDEYDSDSESYDSDEDNNEDNEDNDDSESSDYESNEDNENNEDNGIIQITTDRCFTYGCANCRRKQSRVFVNEIDGIISNRYCIRFKRHRTDSIISSRKFKFCRSHRSAELATNILLCFECSNHLTCNDNNIAKENKNTWPGFIWSILQNKDIHEKYGIYVWKFIPRQWRHWWLSNTTDYIPLVYSGISIDEPKSIFVDLTTDIDNWNDDINSFQIARLANACDKYLIPNILCPWGCSEFNHK